MKTWDRVIFQKNIYKWSSNYKHRGHPGVGLRAPNTACGAAAEECTLQMYVDGFQGVGCSLTAVTNLHHLAVVCNNLYCSDCLGVCVSGWLSQCKIRPTKSTEQKGTLCDALKEFQVGRQVHFVLCSLMEYHLTRPRHAAQDPVSQFRRMVAKAPEYKNRRKRPKRHSTRDKCWTL